NNAGAIVGGYFDQSGVHGYLSNGGTFTTLDAPGAVNGSYAQGINNLGQIVGSLYDAAGNSHAYLLAGGQFTAIPQLFQANAINDAGQIVGFGYDANNIFRSFLLSNG